MQIFAAIEVTDVEHVKRAALAANGSDADAPLIAHIACNETLY